MYLGVKTVTGRPIGRLWLMDGLCHYPPEVWTFWQRCQVHAALWVEGVVLKGRCVSVEEQRGRGEVLCRDADPLHPYGVKLRASLPPVFILLRVRLRSDRVRLFVCLCSPAEVSCAKIYAGPEQTVWLVVRAFLIRVILTICQPVALSLSPTVLLSPSASPHETHTTKQPQDSQPLFILWNRHILDKLVSANGKSTCCPRHISVLLQRNILLQIHTDRTKEGTKSP